MNDSIDPNLESLPGWALSALEAALSPPPSRSALVHRGTAAWPLMVDAAVISDFLPRDLAPDAGVIEENRAEVEKIVLGFAETSHGPDGIKWSLTQPTRAEVLGATLQTIDLKEAITRTAGRFDDPISKALRECLTTGPSASETSTLNSLEATRVAVALLSGVSGVKLPKLEDLDREIEFRRLMKPFERMVCRATDDTGSGMADRFFGRGEEMERLRDYVGVIPADSIIGSVKRSLNWVSRTIKGRATMMVWGVGGVGKTTLISKFMLEHANAAASRFPFAYLDFDRATISARRRLGLLAEMCLQTGAQFEELSEPLANLRSRALALARKLETKQEFEEQTYVTHFTLEFRRLVDDHLNKLESRLEWARPFLLVLDTFEVVQYAQDDILCLEEFIHGFSKEGESGAWPRLRLIISGRKNVTNFMGTVEDLPLGALDPEGSAEMMLALARDRDKSISRADAKRLISALAKATGERNGGVQPLRLRLIGEVFQKAQENGPSIVRSLVKELNQPLTLDGLAAQALIDGILIRRVLSHVGDPRVKALADPGLVVRFITPDVIKEVMTRGTPNPSAGEPEDADANTAEPWIINQTEAKSIFDAFSIDVSLVEVEEAGLRHRPDVRRQMLPLIRARRPKQFEALNRLAFDYFSAKAELDEKDLVSAAEAVYHGLWLNEPLSKLNRLWRNSPIFDPRIDPEEFDEGGLANIFVRAKARAALTSNEVSRLPREVALDWLDTRSADLLEDHRIEGAIRAIHTAAGDSYEALDDRIGTAAVLARLLYRAGSWNDAVQLALRYLDPSYDAKLEKLSDTDEKAALLSLLRTWATIVGKSGGPPQAIHQIAMSASSVRDPMVRVELSAYALIASLKYNDYWQIHPNVWLKSAIRGLAPAISLTHWIGERQVMRLAILTGGRDALKLLEFWVESSDRVPRDIEVFAISDLLKQIFRQGPAGSEVIDIVEGLHLRQREQALNKLDELWRREKATVLESLRTRDDLKTGFYMLVAFDHADWVRPLGNALARALKQEYGEALAAWLNGEKFLAGKGANGRRHDGIAIVRSALTNGRLLELASALERWNETILKKETGGMRSAYPQDVFSISHALSRWHSTIVESFVPPHRRL